MQSENMRTGPDPISVHLSMAASSLAGFYAQQEGAEERASEDMQKMLRGIRAYQLHEFKPVRGALEVIWQEGAASLNVAPDCNLQGDQPLMLLVPSLVNRSYILDLMAERSLMRWLGEQGIHVALLDWGEVVEDTQQNDIEGCIINRLIPAIEFLAQQAGNPIHVLGYCMGGTLSLGAALHARACIKSLTFLAAPWDFHAGSSSLMTRVKFWAPSAFPMIADKGYLPLSWVQTVFASLDPISTVRKFSNFADMDQESEEAKLFVAVEDWLNDGVDLPDAIARQAINDWFLGNQTAQGEWHVGDMAIEPEKVECPSLIIASDKDRLVEYETASSLQKKIPGAELVNPGCGHIGMIAGARAPEQVWKHIAAWVHQNS